MVSDKRKSNARTSREEILAVASRLYLEQGVKGISMRSIGKAIGLTPMALYRHFENKDALQRALLMEAFGTFTRYLYQSLKGRDARERFYLCVKAYFEFAMEQSNYFGLIFLSTNPLDAPGLSEVIRDESAPPFRFLIDRVRDCMEEGYFKKGDVYECSIALLAQSTGMASLRLSNSIELGAEEAWEKHWRSMELVLSGFVAGQCEVS